MALAQGRVSHVRLATNSVVGWRASPKHSVLAVCDPPSSPKKPSELPKISADSWLRSGAPSRMTSSRGEPQSAVRLHERVVPKAPV
jgi:hypothetical protein